MSRLILVPQYPTKLRYQQWWWSMFRSELINVFSEVIVLGENYITKRNENAGGGAFAPLDASINLELEQVREYMELRLQVDDVLLLNDISYPGIFANVLYHKKPKRCYAICHATSKNRYDYFASVRFSKYPVEKGISKLFDRVIVASEYHRKKLGWDNLEVFPLPYPFVSVKQILNGDKKGIIIASRKGIQKRTLKLEGYVSVILKQPIIEIKPKDWEEYYSALAMAKVLLITAKEETFGYQIIDAVKAGCIPIAPNKFSYSELLPDEYLYNSFVELLDKITSALLGKLKPLQETDLKTYKMSQYFFNNLISLLKG